VKPLREVFGEALLELGAKNETIFALDADLAKATRSSLFGERFPDRFFNVGITEANMVSVASGLASCGKIPFACTFSFLLALRAADQIRSQVCYPMQNVKLIGTNAGLSGFGDGATHQCVLDISVMRAMPNMTVIEPSDEKTVREAVFQAAEIEGPVYIRISRVEAPDLHSKIDDITVGKGVLLRNGNDVTLIASGLMVHKAMTAAESLSEAGISAQVLEIHTAKPLDKESILRCARNTGAVVVVEEHSLYGGLCSAVSETLITEYPVPAEFVAIQDRFGESGQYEEILEVCGLTIENIVQKAKSAVSRK
jgi:transketolase